MTRLLPLLVAGALFGLTATAGAQAPKEASYSLGGDQYAAGQNIGIQSPVAHDAFMAGYDVNLSAPVAGDAHMAGFNVTAGADVGGDLYAAGFTVTVAGKVGGDVSAMGNTVTLRSPASVPGNARLAGQSVTVASPLDGSAVIVAQTLRLDAPIAGDLTFTGESIVFGAGAKVAGAVLVQGPKEISVPAEVASADRVTFRLMTPPDYMSEAGRTAESVVKGFWPVFWAAVAWWAVLLIVGSAFIALMPKGLAALQTVSEKRPFRNIGLGILAFASVVGLVPVIGLTVIGLILIPFVLLFAAIFCSLAYLAGVYLAGVRLAGAFLPVDTNLKRLGVLAVALIAAALLGMIPFAGWLISLLLVTFGFGVIAMVIMVRWSRGDAARLQQAGTPAVGTA